MSAALKKLREEPRPDVFGYHDYKSFLKDYLEYLKFRQPRFSIRKLALQSQISVGYLSTVLNSKLDISIAALEKLFPFLDLSDDERGFLVILSQVNESEPQEARIKSLERLQKFKKYRQLNGHEVMVFEYFSKWYHVAIREMANLPDFQLNPKWIQAQLNFKVSVSEVVKGVEFLLENKLIKFSSAGVCIGTRDYIKCDGNNYRFILTQFHKKFFELAGESIDNTERDFRNITSQTMSLSKPQFSRAKEIMDQALKDISSLALEGEKVEDVYHFVFSGFPLTKARRGKS